MDVFFLDILPGQHIERRVVPEDPAVFGGDGNGNENRIHIILNVAGFLRNNLGRPVERPQL
ncbi:hypothetical protein SDC9_211183 [bioreactor metagenome]|uniref:Uncharacterized protein n=1 Tax=bioreactor metagenome TaxID=1076179 RepID=A0A645JU28_9ZZZZ